MVKAVLAAVSVIVAGACTGGTDGSMSPTSAVEAAPDSGQLSARFIVDQAEVVAGGDLSVVLVITNTGDRRVERWHNGCQPKWYALIDRGRSPSGHAFTMECVRAPLVVEPGENRFEVAVSAREQWCSQDADAAPEIRCVDSLPPELPPGDYFVKLASTGGMVIPPAVPIRVTAIEDAIDAGSRMVDGWPGVRSAIDAGESWNGTLTGALFSDRPGVWFLCGVVLESLPSQCGEPSIELDFPAGTSHHQLGIEDFEEHDEVRLSKRSLTTRGRVEAGARVFTVEFDS